MKIKRFWANGFRSLRDVDLPNLGAINVFYGPNGSGKSNILAAIDAWQKLVPIALGVYDPPGLTWHEQPLARGQLAYVGEKAPVKARDIALHSKNRKITLGAEIIDPKWGEAKIELYLDAGVPFKPVLNRYVLVNGITLEESSQITPAQDKQLNLLGSIAWECQFSLIPADRMPRTEASNESPPPLSDAVSWYFRNGRLKDALFAAQNADSPKTLKALDRFRQFMAGPPLHRPSFRTVEDPHTRVRDLREWLPKPLDEHEVSLDLAGLGIAQIYWILGQAMLSGARAIGIEEPEAHLHAPTTGRHLRSLLARLVSENHVDQLFLATHSNLFDLDDQGFWEVRLENGETIVLRKPLDDIDQHLYEPGPTLHAFEELLRLSDPERIMFRRADGTPVSAKEMLGMLRAADPVALEYLTDLHKTAVDVVGLRARRKGAS